MTNSWQKGGSTLGWIACSILLIGAAGIVASASSARAADAADKSEKSDKLVIKVIKKGKGKVADAKKNPRVTVHYTGTFADGKKFDSSVDRGTPFTFVLGAGQVIKGWDQGVDGMKVGEKRHLIIPSSLGYGDAGAPPAIPPGATLHFDVELLDVQ